MTRPDPDWGGLWADLRLLPNIISLSRLLLIVPIALLLPLESEAAFGMTIALLILSYLSDYADGYIARRMGLSSRLGLILDPIADKAWTAVMLILLARWRDFPIWMAAVFIGRDILILALNVYSFRQTGTVMASDQIGRKYLVVIGAMIIALALRLEEAVYIGYILVPVAAVTIVRYFRSYMRLQTAARAEVVR